MNRQSVLAKLLSSFNNLVSNWSLAKKLNQDLKDWWVIERVLSTHEIKNSKTEIIYWVTLTRKKYFEDLHDFSRSRLTRLLLKLAVTLEDNLCKVLKLNTLHSDVLKLTFEEVCCLYGYQLDGWTYLRTFSEDRAYHILAMGDGKSIKINSKKSLKTPEAVIKWLMQEYRHKYLIT